MNSFDCDWAKQLAEIARAQQQFRTGHLPSKVDIALAGDSLIVVLHNALTAAEKILANDPKAADRLQAFHRELFLNSSNTMKQEIAKITGRAVRETASELETGAAALVYAPLTGVMIQVYLLNSHANPCTRTLDEHDDK